MKLSVCHHKIKILHIVTQEAMRASALAVPPRLDMPTDMNMGADPMGKEHTKFMHFGAKLTQGDADPTPHSVLLLVIFKVLKRL